MWSLADPIPSRHQVRGGIARAQRPKHACAAVLFCRQANTVVWPDHDHKSLVALRVDPKADFLGLQLALLGMTYFKRLFQLIAQTDMVSTPHTSPAELNSNVVHWE